MAHNAPSLTAVLHGIVKSTPGLDARTIADMVGKPYQTLMSELSRQDGHKLGADLVLPLCRVTDSDVAVQFLAREVGGVFIRLPDVPTGGGELVQTLAASVKEFGDFASETAADISDGKIPAEQLARIEKEGDEAIEAIMQMKKLARVVHEAQYGPGRR